MISFGPEAVDYLFTFIGEIFVHTTNGTVRGSETAEDSDPLF